MEGKETEEDSEARGWEQEEEGFERDRQEDLVIG